MIKEYINIGNGKIVVSDENGLLRSRLYDQNDNIESILLNENKQEIFDNTIKIANNEIQEQETKKEMIDADKKRLKDSIQIIIGTIIMIILFMAYLGIVEGLPLFATLGGLLCTSICGYGIFVFKKEIAKLNIDKENADKLIEDLKSIKEKIIKEKSLLKGKEKYGLQENTIHKVVSLEGKTDQIASEIVDEMFGKYLYESTDIVNSKVKVKTRKKQK